MRDPPLGPASQTAGKPSKLRAGVLKKMVDDYSLLANGTVKDNKLGRVAGEGVKIIENANGTCKRPVTVIILRGLEQDCKRRKNFVPCACSRFQSPGIPGYVLQGGTENGRKRCL